MEYRQGTYVGYYFEQGIEQGQYQFICSFLDLLSDEQIASRTNYTVDEIARIREKYV